MDWQAIRDRSVGFAIITGAATLGVFAAAALIVGCAVLLAEISGAVR